MRTGHAMFSVDLLPWEHACLAGKVPSNPAVFAFGYSAGLVFCWVEQIFEIRRLLPQHDHSTSWWEEQHTEKNA